MYYENGAPGYDG
jgi:antitoxin component YwqK of YwqJK toxin-antitoxin module